MSENSLHGKQWSGGTSLGEGGMLLGQLIPFHKPDLLLLTA